MSSIGSWLAKSPWLRPVCLTACLRSLPSGHFSPVSKGEPERQTQGDCARTDSQGGQERAPGHHPFPARLPPPLWWRIVSRARGPLIGLPVVLPLPRPCRRIPDLSVTVRSRVPPHR